MTTDKIIPVQSALLPLSDAKRGESANTAGMISAAQGIGPQLTVLTRMYGLYTLYL